MAYITETTDAAQDTSTTYTINPGDFFFGTASSAGSTFNNDWIRVTLLANTTYTISLNTLGLFGAGLNDAYLQLLDGNGTVIAGNDDGGPGLFSQITFTTGAAGTYYLGAGSAISTDSGQYILNVTAGSKGSFDQNMGGAALYGAEASWSPNAAGTGVNVTYAIRGSGSAFDASGAPTAFQNLSAAQIAAVQQATAMYSDVCGVTFTQVNPGGTSENATVLFGGYSSTTDGSGAYAYFPGSTAAASSDGDVWINNTAVSRTSLPFGSYDYFAIMHELGHAVGLSHPGDYNAAPGVNITYAANAQFIQDSQQYTVMSYFDASASGANLGGYADTPMLYDIYALQQLYGANYATRATNTTYGFNSNAGAVYNFAINTSPGICIWDGNGIDTIDLSGWSMAQTVNLNSGEFSSVGGLVKNLSIAFGAIIENAIGGSGNDVMTGNQADNMLFGAQGNDNISGAGGNDNLYGGAGADVMNGGADFDLARYEQSSTGVYVRLDGGAGATGDAAGDTFISIEGLVGSNFADVFVGDSVNADYLFGLDGADNLYGLGGADYMDGGVGDDYLTGGAGADILIGGFGFDLARYDGAATGIYARLDGLDGFSGEAAGDTFTSIEGLIGSNFDDIFIGNDTAGDYLLGLGGSDRLIGLGGGDTLDGGAGVDTLEGGAGNDNLFGGAGGDILNGGADFDFSRYDSAISGVYARLDGFAASYGEATGDTFVSIEGLIGSNFDDILVGSNTNSDYLFGLAGADSLIGLDGADYLDGGAGNDNLYGGLGADTLNGGDGFDLVRYDSAASGVYARLDGVAASAGEAAGDSFIGIEGLIGSQFNDTFVGSNTAGDYLFGQSGSDLFYGLGGNDYIDGGVGNDTLYGGAGADQFVFNTALNAATNIDTIGDFQAGVDDIMLSQAIFTGISTILDAAEFQLGSADAATDRILYFSTTGQLFFDADGNGAGVAVQFATVTSGTALTLADFVMIA